ENMPDLIERLNNIDGIEDIGLTTNGVLLGKYAEPLYDAGLRRLNLSLDALDPFVFGEMNGKGTNPQIVLRNIELAKELVFKIKNPHNMMKNNELAKELGFQIKANMGVKKGVNEHEILPMATHFKERGITLRFIAFMDVGNDNAWSFEIVVTKKDIYKMLAEEFDLEPVEIGRAHV